MMLKRLGVLTILIVLALMTSVPAVSARGQISDTGVVWVDPLQHTPVQVPIPDISLPVAEAVQSAPAPPAAQPQGGPPPDRGQALITGSFRIEFNERVIHININARAGEEGPNGHIHWREVGGKNYRTSVAILMFATPFDEEHPLWWPADCGFVRGYFENDEGGEDMMCLQICGDRVHNLFWNFESIYRGDFTSGKVVIKP